MGRQDKAGGEKGKPPLFLLLLVGLVVFICPLFLGWGPGCSAGAAQWGCDGDAVQRGCDAGVVQWGCGEDAVQCRFTVVGMR